MPRIEDLKTPVESSVFGRPTKRSPSSPTSVCTPCSIAVSKGRQIMVHKEMGLVSQVFNENALNSLTGAHLAVGHCRYSTTGASVWMNAQPTFRPTATGGIALGHNGNLTNTLELREWLSQRDQAEDSLLPGSLLNEATNDTSLITALLATFPGLSTEQAAI